METETALSEIPNGGKYTSEQKDSNKLQSRSHLEI